MAKTQFHSSGQLSYKRLIGAIIALIAFFLLLTSVIGLAEKYFAIRGRTKELQVQQSTLKNKETTLTEENAYLDTDDGKQQLLRSKYNVVRPGEEMIIISQPAGAPAPAPVEQSRVAHWWDTLLRSLGLRKDE